MSRFDTYCQGMVAGLQLRALLRLEEYKDQGYSEELAMSMLDDEDQEILKVGGAGMKGEKVAEMQFAIIELALSDPEIDDPEKLFKAAHKGAREGTSEGTGKGGGG